MAHDPTRYRSRLWKQRRAQALHRSGFRCERCGQPGRLEVHHKIRIADGGADELDNLECLCRRCHFAEHESKPRSNRTRKRLELPGRAEWDRLIEGYKK